MSRATELGDAAASYRRDGFAVFRNVIDADLIGEARDHVEWIQRQHPQLRPEHLHHPLMRDDAFWVRLITDDRLIDIVRYFLGDDIACFTSHYICKPARDGQAVLWHQDGAYWHLEPMDALTVWLAVDDSRPENGCLRMIPGSHRSEISDIVIRKDVPNMLSSSIDPALVDDGAAIDVVLGSGDISIHHPRIIHGSESNRSPHRRCGLDIGYIRTDTRLGATGLYLNPILCCGEARPGVNRYRPWPVYDPDTTIPFRGREGWDGRAARMNSCPGVIASSAPDERVADLAALMVARLEAGTTKLTQAT